MNSLVAGNANNGDTQQRGVGLADVTVQARFTDLFDENGIGVLDYAARRFVDFDSDDPDA